jgi:hypothetical protein
LLLQAAAVLPMPPMVTMLLLLVYRVLLLLWLCLRGCVVLWVCLVVLLQLHPATVLVQLLCELLHC